MFKSLVKLVFSLLKRLFGSLQALVTCDNSLQVKSERIGKVHQEHLLPQSVETHQHTSNELANSARKHCCGKNTTAAYHECEHSLPCTLTAMLLQTHPLP